VEERTEILRRLNVEFNARADGWLDFYADDVEFLMPAEWPDERVLRGRAAVDRAVSLWSENVDDYGWDEERLIETEDCVVGLYRHRGRIRGTDQRIAAEVGALFHFEGATIVRVVTFSTWAAALEAAGIEVPAQA
jgi:ketosteroid isomerase-like protein